MAKTLVIVESPAKARTLSRFLGDRYRVEASYGHVRDLPDSADQVPEEIRKKKWGRLGVDTDGDFKPYYVIPSDKKKHVQALKLAMKDASEVVLATDPDREGESISWHLLEVLKPKVPVRRIHFHEITESAIREALATVDSVDQNRVRAQETRRILDRLFGYTLSPVLWKKVQTGLSAGRVQSVAVRLIVEREEERRAFRAGVYWDLEARVRGSRPRIHGDAGPDWRRSARHRQGLRRRDRATRGGRQGPAAHRGRRPGAGRGVERASAVDGHVGRGETVHAAAGAALHHLHAAAGSEPQARLLRRSHHANRAAAVPGRRAQRRPHGRAHLLPPHRFHDALRESARRGGQRDQPDVRRRSTTGGRGSIRRRCGTPRRRTRRSGRPSSCSRRSRCAGRSMPTSCGCTT